MSKIMLKCWVDRVKITLNAIVKHYKVLLKTDLRLLKNQIKKHIQDMKDTAISFGRKMWSRIKQFLRDIHVKIIKKELEYISDLLIKLSSKLVRFGAVPTIVDEE